MLGREEAPNYAVAKRAQGAIRHLFITTHVLSKSYHQSPNNGRPAKCAAKISYLFYHLAFLSASLQNAFFTYLFNI